MRDWRGRWRHGGWRCRRRDWRQRWHSGWALARPRRCGRKRGRFRRVRRGRNGGRGRVRRHSAGDEHRQEHEQPHRRALTRQRCRSAVIVFVLSLLLRPRPFFSQGLFTATKERFCFRATTGRTPSRRRQTELFWVLPAMSSGARNAAYRCARGRAARCGFEKRLTTPSPAAVRSFAVARLYCADSRGSCHVRVNCVRLACPH